MWKLVAAIALLLFSSAAGATISVDVLSGSLYDSVESAMNADLGITASYLVEDFEDTVLVSGLTVDVENHTTGFDVVAPVGGLFWDGANVLSNADVSMGLDGNDVTFNVGPATTRFGIGISIMDNPSWPQQVIVNGDTVFTTEIFLDPHWQEPATPGEHIRNGYIWFTADGGDSLSSIKFQTAPSSGDTIYFDHAAILVPEPSTGALLAIGLALLGLHRRDSTSPVGSEST